MYKATGIALLFLLLAGPVTLKAQSGDVWSGGTMYSNFGFGLPFDFTSTYADGMGINGVAMSDPRIASSANPAEWATTIFTNISGAFEMRGYDTKSGSDVASFMQYQAGPFNAVFPVKRERIGISFSVTPMSSSRFVSENRYVLENNLNHAREDLFYTVENRGGGGLNRIETGIGIRIGRSLSVGYAPSLYIGSITRDQNVFFEDDRYRDTRLRGSTSHYGFGNRFGIRYMQRGLFREADRSVLAATVSLPVSFNSERSLESRLGVMDVTLNPASYYGSGQAKWPLMATAGIAHHFNRFFVMSGDVVYQNWSQYTNFDGVAEEAVKDRIRVGLGGQYLPFLGPQRSFFSRFVYRMGVSYDSGFLSFDGNDIDSFSLHMGIGIPSPAVAVNSSIDINAEVGIRGTDSFGLMQERFFAIKIAFNLSEFMFTQRLLQ